MLNWRWGKASLSALLMAASPTLAAAENRGLAAQPPPLSAVSDFRVARPSNALEPLRRFYVDGLGLEVIAEFADHDGFDGLIVRLPASKVQIEFSVAPGHPAPRLSSVRQPRVLLAALCLSAAGGCVSVSPVDPVRDDGSPGFAAACVRVLAAGRAARERGGADLTVEGHRALSEWMFQASRRSSLFDDEIGRAAERCRWAETLPAEARQARARTCI